jgi:hypothetical protein
MLQPHRRNIWKWPDVSDGVNGQSKAYNYLHLHARFHLAYKQMKKTSVLLAGLTLFIVILIGINILHFRSLTVNVVLYSTLADVFAALILTGVFVGLAILLGRPDSTIISTLRQFSRTEFALFFFCTILLGYIYAITVPTVIDRSLSIYILEKLDQRGGEIPVSAMRDVFVNEYVPEYRLVDVRLTEQLSSGTISIENGCVKLTQRGKLIADITHFYRTKLLPKKRVLMGGVTDDLVDPFRRSPPVADYRCGSPKTVRPKSEY